ncbi:sensor histidine kinase [Tenacibaculum agarivorans]|uniref:sensor histidine kinase n=1 Tax=Tenacibaculum agarivorans TaxID=1908389 RepID=UPI00094BB0FD|nr:sensor histidine kinase [Tenacibaculum agarivorans]
MKKLSLFLTNANHINFRSQLINIVLIIGVLASLTSAIINVIADVDIEVHILNILVGLVYSICYYHARFKNRYEQVSIVIVVFTIGIIDVLWFQSGGLKGAMLLYVLVSTASFIIFIEKKYLRFFIAFALINTISLLLLERFTTWVTPYSSDSIRFLDVSLSFVIVLCLFVLLIRWLVNQYEFQRKRSEEKTERIEFLLKELNHRVKNNLQLISSLIGLQVSRLEDQTAIDALNTGKDRIMAMGKIHTLLYQNNSNETINFQKYLEDIVSGLIFKYTSETEIDYELIIEEKQLSSNEALYLGLIINEAITNAMKYAFEGIKDPKIFIDFRSNAYQIKKLTIRDNGVGIIDSQKNYKGLGSKIIALLTEQINGKLEIQSENGVMYQLTYSYEN